MKRLLITLGIILAATTCIQAQQWLPGGQGVPIVCAYSSSPPTIASGGFIYAQCDTNGKLITSGGGVTSSVAVTPTETASSAYVAGNEVGSLMTFSSAVGTAGSGVIESLHVVATSVQTTGLKLYLFTANPSSTTWTDKTTPAIAAADVPKLIGVYALSFPDNGLGTMTVWNLDGMQKAFAGASGGFLYGVLVCTATPTFTTTTDLTVTISDLEN